MSADTLTATSRTFYERAKSKLALSIVLGASALVMLGFCSAAGGQAQSATDAKDSYSGDDEQFEALSAGYGFASFCFIVAFILFLSAAIYISPLMCGSNNEKKMLRSPQEIDNGYAAYAEGTPVANASAPPV